MKLSFKLIILLNLVQYIVGQTCSLGSYLSNNQCYYCPNGYYCPIGATRPIPCPVGTFSYSPGAISQCTLCPLGYYANKPASTSCIACPNGYFCKDPSIAPTPCPLGTYSTSTGGISECTTCRLGYYANKVASTQCTACPNGYYCKDPTKAPTPCPLGSYSYSSGGISECKLCQLGYYANKTASTSCIACPNGYQCCDARKSPTSCPLGTFSTSPGGISECVPCSLGYYANKTTSTSCIVCPNGYQCCDAKMTPTPCPVGTYSYSSGGIWQCKACALGDYASKTASTSCIACPNGYYCCDPKISPTPCPIGTYSYSSYGIWECKSCSSGYYTDTVASTGCKYCPNGLACQTTVIPPSCTPMQTLMETCSRNVELEKQQLKCNPSDNIQDLEYLADVGDCNFYKELENEKKCGLNGYLIKYGLKYCNKFGEQLNGFNTEVYFYN